MCARHINLLDDVVTQIELIYIYKHSAKSELCGQPNLRIKKRTNNKNAPPKRRRLMIASCFFLSFIFSSCSQLIEEAKQQQALSLSLFLNNFPLGMFFSGLKSQQSERTLWLLFCGWLVYFQPRQELLSTSTSSPSSFSSALFVNFYRGRARPTQRVRWTIKRLSGDNYH